MDKILIGHVSPDTAYVVNDYPYSFHLRCRIRYWIEIAEKGAKKGQYRLMSQTTNPKITSAEVWNKPKGGTYSHFEIMILCGENGHVESRALHVYDGADRFIKFKKMLIDAGAQSLVDLQKSEFDALSTVMKRVETMEKISRRVNPVSWAEFDKEQAKTSGYVSDAQTD